MDRIVDTTEELEKRIEQRIDERFKAFTDIEEKIYEFKRKQDALQKVIAVEEQLKKVERSPLIEEFEDSEEARNNDLKKTIF